MINVDAFRERARRCLPRPVFDFMEGGADDEIGIAHNKAVLEELKFVPRRLIDVSARSLTSRFMGQERATPLVVGPTGLNGLLWPNGDRALARAAAAEGIPFVLSTASNASIEDIAKASDGEKWFQLYVLDREIADSLVQRAWRAGFGTLVLTVDVPLDGNRERDARNGFNGSNIPLAKRLAWAASRPAWALRMALGPKLSMANLEEAGPDGMAMQAALLKRRMDDSFDWAALARLRDRWPGKLVIKGILHAEDAERARCEGADGIVLSNHGGRQLDAAISPIQALQAIGRAWPEGVAIDGGFRRGADVVKAMALGASTVLLGRAVLYGLASEGEQGARSVLRMLHKEASDTLGQLGVTNPSELEPGILTERRES